MGIAHRRRSRDRRVDTAGFNGYGNRSRSTRCLIIPWYSRRRSEPGSTPNSSWRTRAADRNTEIAPAMSPRRCSAVINRTSAGSRIGCSATVRRSSEMADRHPPPRDEESLATPRRGGIAPERLPRGRTAKAAEVRRARVDRASRASPCSATIARHPLGPEGSTGVPVRNDRRRRTGRRLAEEPQGSNRRADGPASPGPPHTTQRHDGGWRRTSENSALPNAAVRRARFRRSTPPSRPSSPGSSPAWQERFAASAYRGSPWKSRKKTQKPPSTSIFTSRTPWEAGIRVVAP